jgi:hypothetical protein
MPSVSSHRDHHLGLSLGTSCEYLFESVREAEEVLVFTDFALKELGLVVLDQSGLRLRFTHTGGLSGSRSEILSRLGGPEGLSHSHASI